MSDVIFEVIEEDVVFEIQNGNTYNVNGAEKLDDLTDVQLTAPTINDVLRYDGTEWVENDLSDKANTIHVHEISDVTNLQDELDSKASDVHVHSESDITNLVGHLAAKSDVGHSHTIANVTNLQTTLDGKAAVSHNHTISQVTSLQTSLDAKQNTITGAVSTVTTSNLNPSAVVTTNAFGKITTSPTISSTELSYLDGATSNLQTQINGKASTSHTHDDRYYTESETTTLLNSKQDSLVSGTNIKTVNNTSLLGAGNIEITAGAGALSQLTDVDLTNLATGEILVYDGTNWVNQDGGSQAMTHKVLSNTLNTWNDLFSFTLNDGGLFGSQILMTLQGKTNEGSGFVGQVTAIVTVARDGNSLDFTYNYEGISATSYDGSGISISDQPNLRAILSTNTVTIQLQTDYSLTNPETILSVELEFALVSNINSITTNPNVSWGDITGSISNQTDLDLILNGLQPALDFTPEDVGNKATDLTTPDNTTYPSTLAITTALGGYSETSHNHSLANLTEKSYSSLTDKPSLFSGSYSDLTNKPTIPTLPIAISDVTSLSTSLEGKQVIHGFENRTDTSLSFVDGTRTFTITGTNFKVFNKGALQTKNTESIVIPNTVGVHYIYYNSSNVLTTSTTAWVIGLDMPIALIIWNGTAGLIADERHRSSETHEYLHNVLRTMYASGLSATFGNSTFQVDNGVLYDEDIKLTIPTTTSAKIVYRSGSSLDWTPDQTNYMQVGGSYQYDNSGTLTAVTINQYFAIWVYGTDLIDDGIIFVLGQRQDNTLTAARDNNSPSSLDTSFLPVPEMKLLYRVICRNNATSYIETTDYRATSITGSNFTATDHQTLTNRSATDAHPISSITDLTTTLSGKSDTSHTHDDRYYTETEIDTMIGDIETLLAAL